MNQKRSNDHQLECQNKPKHLDSVSWDSPTGPCLGCRHVQIFLCFTLLVLAYAMRVAMSVAVVAMNDPHASSNPDIPTFNWTNSNVILSSLGWGYIVFQFIAGGLLKRFGVKWLLVASMSLNSFFFIIIPEAATLLGSTGVILCRISQGLSQGFFFPAVSVILSKWLPKQERARMGTFVYVGSSLGTMIGMVITGYLASGYLGWPGAFYIFGGFGFLWVLFWLIFGCEEPSNAKRITQDELKYIESNLGCKKENCRNIPTPYKKILTSLPVWAIIVTGIGNLWGAATLFSDMPMYLQGVLNFDIKENSMLSAAPYMAVLIFNSIFSTIADLLINRKILSITTVRKVFTTIGMLGPAMALVALAYSPGKVLLSVGLLVLTMGINAASNSGIIVNMFDLSPNHSGVVMGICNGTITLASIFAPLMVQGIVTDKTNTEQWKTIFLISAAFFVVPAIFYDFAASAKVQSWNENPISKEEEAEVECRRRITPRITAIDMDIGVLLE